MTRSNNISTVLVISSMAFAAGTYLARPTPAPEPLAPAVAAVVAPAPSPAPVQPRVTPAMRKAGAEQAQIALLAWHPVFVERCWEPSAALHAEPEQIPLRFNLSFDPRGALVGLGISQNRAAYRSDVTACLRKLGVQVKIPAPGLPLQVEVPITLP
jgi:hypothetical protein